LSLVRNHSKEWKVLSAVEARTRTSPTSVRLPDVVIHKMGEWPTILVQPAMIVIEILSVGDSMTEMEEKCDAYEAMGISDIWLINPARRRGKVWKLGNWTEVTRFEAKGTEIYLDVHWLSRRPMASRQRSKQGVPR
jgi:Uma2 family endonuclease